MTHPLLWVRAHQRTILLAVSVAATSGIAVLLRRVSPRSPGVISLQLAGTPKRVRGILNSWGDEGRKRAIRAIHIDYLFIPAYSTALALLCLMVGHGGLAIWIAWCQWIAGCCDGLENAAILKMLQTGEFKPWARISWCAAGVKFGLVLLGILYVVGAGAWFALPGRR